MRSIYLIVVFVVINLGFLHAQKAKFKGGYYIAQKAILPIHFSEPDERTYDLVTQGSYSTDIIPHAKKLYGWSVNSENPNMKAVVNLYDYSLRQPKKSSEKKTKKDKEGKVTESWTEYNYSSSARGSGTLYVYGFDRPFQYESPRKKKSKADLKREAKEAEKKEDLADNPFLTGKNIDEAEAGIGSDEVHEAGDLPLVANVSIDQVLRYTTNNYRSTAKAYAEYKDNHRPALLSFENTYPNQSYKVAMQELNALYGFAPGNFKVYMKSMKTEDHPDAKMWNDACQAAETIFKSFRFNKQIEEKQQQLMPVVQYFLDQVEKIDEGDKKGRNQRKAAYQNVLYMFYYLDLHGEVIAWSEKHLESKSLSPLAKRMLEKSEKQLALLNFHKMSTRHISTQDEVDQDDILLESLVEDEVADDEGN